MPKTVKYPYKLTVNLRDFQAEYLEAKVKDGTFVSINHAIRNAIDLLSLESPVKKEVS